MVWVNVDRFSEIVKDIGDISREDIQDYVEAAKSQGMSNASYKDAVLEAVSNPKEFMDDLEKIQSLEKEGTEVSVADQITGLAFGLSQEELSSLDLGTDAREADNEFNKNSGLSGDMQRATGKLEV